MGRNRALVDLLLDRKQDIYCLQVHRTALPASIPVICLLTQRPWEPNSLTQPVHNKAFFALTLVLVSTGVLAQR